MISSLIRFCGSLGLGIAILCLLVVLLAWGTLIESEYGPAVSKFVLYNNPGFALLLLLLVLNVTCSLLSRLPWKKHHLPFLLAHGGIIILLMGCFVTWRCGLEAQITLAEGHAGNKAIQMDRQHFAVTCFSHDGVETQSTFQVPFTPGPFNWEDFGQNKVASVSDQTGKYRTSLGLAMRWGRRDQGPLKTQRPDIQIEVLDYLAASTVETVPPLELSVRWKKSIRTPTELEGGIQTRPGTSREWEKVRLAIDPQNPASADMAGMREHRRAQSEMLGGEKINLALAQSQAEVDAFLDSRVDSRGAMGDAGTSLAGKLGRLVLYYNGQSHFVDVEQLLQNMDRSGVFAIPDTPLRISEVQFRERGPIIRFAVFAPGCEKEHMVLFPDNPEMNVHARSLGVFGMYWADPEELQKGNPDYADNPMVQKLRQPRIDLLQGPDRKLAYRFWNGNRITETGIVPDRQDVKPKFTVAAGTTNEAEIVVDRFVPQDLPGLRIRSAPVGRRRGTEQYALLQVTVDGNTDVFWLRAVYPTVVPLPPEQDQVRYVYGNGRSFRLQWDFDVVELGFELFLKRFEMRNEPGTRMSSYFSSLVSFAEPGGSPSSADGQDVKISMNQPAVRSGNGRSYRIYQSSYTGPYHPGDLRFHELYDGKIFPWETRPRESLYMSTLSVNDDPGRGLKYLGCFLLAFGTGLFLWRKKRGRQEFGHTFAMR